MVPLRCDHIFFSSPHYLVKKTLKSFVRRLTILQNILLELKPRGIRRHTGIWGQQEPHPCWEHLNWQPSGMLGIQVISWREGGGLNTLFFYCFSRTVPRLVCRVYRASLILQRTLHFYGVTAEAKTEKVVLFFFSVMTDLQARRTSFHTYWNCLAALCGVWLLGQRQWMTQEHCVKLLVNIRGRISQTYLIFLSVITVKISYLACMFSENPASHVKYWPLYLKTLEAALSAEQAWHLIEIPLWC